MWHTNVWLKNKISVHYLPKIFCVVGFLPILATMHHEYLMVLALSLRLIWVTEVWNALLPQDLKFKLFIASRSQYASICYAFISEIIVWVLNVWGFWCTQVVSIVVIASKVSGLSPFDFIDYLIALVSVVVQRITLEVAEAKLWSISYQN